MILNHCLFITRMAVSEELFRSLFITRMTTNVELISDRIYLSFTIIIHNSVNYVKMSGR
jgi:hypothetical protein